MIAIHHGEEIILVIWPIKIRVFDSLQENDKKHSTEKANG